MTETEIKKPVKRKPGQRGKAKFTLQMKDAIYRAFNELGGQEYLVKVGKKDPKVFLGLVAKVLPTELNVSGTVLIDVGQAMLDAETRTKQLEATRHDMIDVTPEAKVLEDKDK